MDRSHEEDSDSAPEDVTFQDAKSDALAHLKTVSDAAKQKKKMAVTLKGRGAKTGKALARGAAASKGGPQIPKSFSIEPTKTSRPVSIKDFVLPKDTKMTISFAPKKTGAANKAPAKKATATKRPKPKTMTVVKKKGGKAQPAKKSPGKGKGGPKVQIGGKKKKPQAKKSPGKKK